MRRLWKGSKRTDTKLGGQFDGKKKKSSPVFVDLQVLMVQGRCGFGIFRTHRCETFRTIRWEERG